MNFSSIELWHRLRDKGLASPLQCRDWAAEALAGMSAEQATNGLLVLQRLIDLEKLTKYQAKVVAGQSQQPLHMGPWIIRRKLKMPVWSEWYEVVSRFSDASDSASVKCFWARVVTAEQLDQLQAANPSLKRISRLCELRQVGLQQVYPAERIESGMLVRLDPLPAVCQDGGPGFPWPSDQVLSAVRRLVAVLAGLHQRQLVHGCLLPDRLCGPPAEVTLAIDPLCGRTLVETSRPLGLLGSSLPGGLQSVQFMAPELLTKSSGATAAGDVYALGCLWWWLHAGRPPLAGQTPAELIGEFEVRGRKVPDSFRLSEPIACCLAHCLAKDPAARFPSALELRRAFEAAEQLTRGVVPKQSRETPSTAAVPATLTPATAITKSAGPEPSATAPLAGSSSAAWSPVSAAAQSRETLSQARTRRRKRSPAWLVPVVAICAFLLVALLALNFSGALKPSTATADRANENQTIPRASRPATEVVELDPRSEHFRIVPSGENLLWAPPSVPAPLPLDLLPPGGQLFLSFRPADLMASPTGRGLLAAFDAPLAQRLIRFSQQVVALEDMDQVSLAFYPPADLGKPTRWAARVRLRQAQLLSELQSKWQIVEELDEAGQTLLRAGELAYYIPEQPLLESQSVREFSVGPLLLMREVAEFEGGRGPLIPPMQKLWQTSDAQADLSLLLAPAFLLSEGRGLLGQAPPRLAAELKELLGRDTRAVGLHMRLEPSWYVETQWIGGSDVDAGQLMVRLRERLEQLPVDVESWLVREPPHAYWRALAVRFPRMLQTMLAYTRFGIEDGVAMANLHLPSQAASNLLLTSWIAFQEGATMIDGAVASGAAPRAMTPLSIDEFLARPIRLVFDQEPIEAALRLVEAEANDGLPPGSPPFKFAIDGAAFELAGITRNQQLRDFKHESKPVRDALTEIARRGNPVPGVSDTRAPDQKLIWVIVDDADNPGSPMVLLSTRDAAIAAQIELPNEFAP